MTIFQGAEDPYVRVGKLRQTILSLPGVRDEAGYNDIRRQVDGLVEYLGGGSLVWRELSLLLNAAFYRDASRDFALLQWIRSERERQGDLPVFEAFWKDVQKVMHPRTLSPHGYITSLAGRDNNVVWQEIAGLTAKISALGCQTFVNSGTLLGLVRTGELIAHDDDVDLAVLLASTSTEAAAIEWQTVKLALDKIWLLDREFERKGNTHCKVGRAGGASVDLFPAWIVDGKAYIYPHTHGEAEVSDLLPLKSHEIAGREVLIPNNPEKILACNYGDGWRIPDPAFRFDWTQAGKRFSVFLEAHRKIRGRA